VSLRVKRRGKLMIPRNETVGNTLKFLLTQYKNEKSSEGRILILNQVIKILAFQPEAEKEIYLMDVEKTTGTKKGKLHKLIKEFERQNQKMSKLKPLKNTILFHPALDFRCGTLLLGFKTFFENANGKIREANFWLYSNIDGQIGWEVGTEKFELFDMFWIPEGLNYRTLLDIKSRWDLTQVEVLIKHKAPIKTMEEIYAAILDLFKEFVELEQTTHYHLLVAWTIGTYFYILFESFPYLFLYGPKSSGKTKTLSILESLCFNAVKCKISLGALTDTSDSLRGTLLLDQAETLKNPDNFDFVSFIADGYKRDSGKRRLINFNSGQRKVCEYETFCPKAFASWKELPEDLRDRVVEIPMLRTTLPLPDLDELSAQRTAEIRGWLYQHLLTQWPYVREAYEQTKEGTGLKGRIRELWRPLETIFRLAKIPENLFSDIKREYLNIVTENQIELPKRVKLLYSAILNIAGEEETIKTTATEIKEVMEEIDVELAENVTPQWIGRIIETNKVGRKLEERLNNKRLWRLDVKRIRKIFYAYYPNNMANLAEDNKNGEISDNNNPPIKSGTHGTHGNMAELEGQKFAKLPSLPSEELKHGIGQVADKSNKLDTHAKSAKCLGGVEEKFFQYVVAKPFSWNNRDYLQGDIISLGDFTREQLKVLKDGAYIECDEEGEVF